jgi:OOP family OmpA-OmpF porin
LGLSYAFGTKTNFLRRDEDPKDAYKKKHGDWAVIKNETAIELESMNERIKEMETQMNDTDKDGVPDYLDRENNSIAGVAVDTRGRMVDLNKNGVPDEFRTLY